MGNKQFAHDQHPNIWVALYLFLFDLFSNMLLKEKQHAKGIQKNVLGENIPGFEHLKEEDWSVIAAESRIWVISAPQSKEER